MSFASKRPSYIFLLIILIEGQYLHSSAQTNPDDTLNQKEPADSKSGRPEDESYMEMDIDMEAKSYSQSSCGISKTKYKTGYELKGPPPLKDSERPEAFEEISGGECTNQHAFPWMARLVG